MDRDELQADGISMELLEREEVSFPVCRLPSYYTADSVLFFLIENRGSTG